MIAFLIAALGLGILAVGLLLLLSSVMPKFGGGNEPESFPLGAMLLGLGLWLIFKAGTFA